MVSEAIVSTVQHERLGENLHNFGALKIPHKIIIKDIFNKI